MIVPIVISEPVSEFGELPQSADFNDPSYMDRDMSYVPGFSDLRRARDKAYAEMVQGKRAPKDVPTLPVNMRWARNQKISGAPDSTKQLSHGNRGYTVATKDMIGQPWLTAMPPGAEVGADGSIRKGDTVLMLATAEQAGKNEQFKRHKTAQRVTGMQTAFAATARQDGAGWKGADPTTKKETLSPISVPVTQATGKES